MTIALPREVVWNAATWVVRGLCEDARPHLADFPGLAPEIQDCLASELYFIDLENAGADLLAEALVLVERVIADNEARGAAGFHDPSGFPVYLGKLRELAALLGGPAGEPRVGPDGRPVWSVQGGRVLVDEGLHLAMGQGIYRGHLAHDPQQARLITQGSVDPAALAALRERMAMDVRGIAELEFIGPVDEPDGVGWIGECIVEVLPRGEVALELAPLDRAGAVALGRDIAAVLERAHAGGIAVGGIRPELVIVRRGASGHPELAGLVPRAAVPGRGASALERGTALHEHLRLAPRRRAVARLGRVRPLRHPVPPGDRRPPVRRAHPGAGPADHRRGPRAVDRRSGARRAPRRRARAPAGRPHLACRAGGRAAVAVTRGWFAGAAARVGPAR